MIYTVLPMATAAWKTRAVGMLVRVVQVSVVRVYARTVVDIVLPSPVDPPPKTNSVPLTSTAARPSAPAGMPVRDAQFTDLAVAVPATTSRRANARILRCIIWELYGVGGAQFKFAAGGRRQGSW